uniref:Uncharacterized protein n=1 Tax=Opuntia streptacantha TaxID=393608 RepID=A0A7C8ZK90_OPUST
MCSRVAGAGAGGLHLVGAWPAAFTLLVDGLQVNLVAVHLQGLGESVVWRIFVAWKSQSSGSPFFFSILGATPIFCIVMFIETRLPTSRSLHTTRRRGPTGSCYCIGVIGA